METSIPHNIYGLDRTISNECKTLRIQLAKINRENNESQSKEIKKALINAILFNI